MRGERDPARRRAIAVTIAGLVAIAAAAAWVTSSSVFSARSIDVRGNHHLTRAVVLRLAGVEPTTNLVWFSPGAVEARLERSPWIERASVSRSLPSRLTIVVRERTPIAVLRAARTQVVAADGTILGSPDGAVGDLPELMAPPGAVHRKKVVASATPQFVVVRSMSASLRLLVDRVEVDSKGLLVAILDGGAVAVYGDATDARAKANALEALLRYAARHDLVVERFDVRAPSRPALLPAPPRSAG